MAAGGRRLCCCFLLWRVQALRRVRLPTTVQSLGPAYYHFRLLRFRNALQREAPLQCDSEGSFNDLGSTQLGMGNYFRSCDMRALVEP